MSSSAVIIIMDFILKVIGINFIGIDIIKKNEIKLIKNLFSLKSKNIFCPS